MDFKTQYQSYSDEKLIKIASSKNDDYLIGAKNAAIEEIKRRGITLDEVEEHSNEEPVGANSFNEKTIDFLTLLKDPLDFNCVATDIQIVRRIALVMAVFTIVGIANLFYELLFGSILFFEEYNTIIMMALGILISLAGSILLWRFHKEGWCICAAYLIYAIGYDTIEVYHIAFLANSFTFQLILKSLLILLSGGSIYWLYQRRIINFLEIHIILVIVVTVSALYYTLPQVVGYYKYINSFY